MVRPHSLGVHATLAVRDNGALVGATRGPSYFCYRAESGLHRLASGEQSVEVMVAPGQRRFVHQRALPRRLTAVPEEIGRAMLARCAYALLVDAPDGEEPITDSERILPAASVPRSER